MSLYIKRNGGIFGKYYWYGCLNIKVVKCKLNVERIMDEWKIINVIVINRSE